MFDSATEIFSNSQFTTSQEASVFEPAEYASRSSSLTPGILPTTLAIVKTFAQFRETHAGSVLLFDQPYNIVKLVGTLSVSSLAESSLKGVFRDESSEIDFLFRFNSSSASYVQQHFGARASPAAVVELIGVPSKQHGNWIFHATFLRVCEDATAAEQHLVEAFQMYSLLGKNERPHKRSNSAGREPASVAATAAGAKFQTLSQDSGLVSDLLRSAIGTSEVKQQLWKQLQLLESEKVAQVEALCATLSQFSTEEVKEALEQLEQVGLVYYADAQKKAVAKL